MESNKVFFRGSNDINWFLDSKMGSFVRFAFALWRAEPARKVSQLLGSIWFYTFGMWVPRGGTCVSPKNEAQVSCKKEESEDGTGEMKTVCTQGTPRVQTLYSFVMSDLCALLWKWSIVQKYRPWYGNQEESLLKTKMSILVDNILLMPRRWFCVFTTNYFPRTTPTECSWPPVEFLLTIPILQYIRIPGVPRATVALLLVFGSLIIDRSGRW